jgi:aconitate hydratase
VPIEFAQSGDYEKMNSGDEFEIENLLEAIKSKDEVTIVNRSHNFEFTGKLNLSARDREILLAAGLLNYTREKASGK